MNYLEVVLEIELEEVFLLKRIFKYVVVIGAFLGVAVGGFWIMDKVGNFIEEINRPEKNE